QIGALTVQSGGVVTHTLAWQAGLVREVTGALDVQSGGTIDLTAKGLHGGYNGSQFGFAGEAFDPSTGAVVAGASGAPGDGAGGSYGGVGSASIQGATPNAAYGLLETPQQLGSGGGGTNCCGPGGHGGGRATITAGSCLINGTLRVNGGTGSNAGGGSGGAILMHVGSLSGAGSIQAIGGDTPNDGAPGNGGGGRIAIFYDSLSLASGNILVYGGYRYRPAAAGTIYLKDNAQTYGDLIVDNGDIGSALSTPWRSTLSTFRSLTLRHTARLDLTNAAIPALTVEQPVSLSSNSALTLNDGVTLNVLNASGFDLEVQSGATLTLNDTSALNADTLRVNGG